MIRCVLLLAVNGGLFFISGGPKCHCMSLLVSRRRTEEFRNKPFYKMQMPFCVGFLFLQKIFTVYKLYNSNHE